MKKLTVLAIAIALMLVAGNAMALPFTFGDGGAALQGVLDGITVGPVPGDSSVDVTMDAMADLSDSYWSITGTGGSVSTVVIELAAFAGDNIFGVYSGGEYVELFDGASGAGDQVALSIKADGSVFLNFVTDTGIDFAGNNFGFYLDSSANAGGGLFHSDTSLNSDGLDHLAAYQGTNTDTVQLPGLASGLWTNNEYVLAWEDLLAPVSDLDYTDFVVMIESIDPNPVPEPGTLLLLGAGLVALVGLRKRMK